MSAETEMDKFTLIEKLFCGSLLDWAAAGGATLTKQDKARESQVSAILSIA